MYRDSIHWKKAEEQKTKSEHSFSDVLADVRIMLTSHLHSGIILTVSIMLGKPARCQENSNL
jgi:hypothetical protein